MERAHPPSPSSYTTVGSSECQAFTKWNFPICTVPKSPDRPKEHQLMPYKNFALKELCLYPTDAINSLLFIIRPD